MPSLYCNTQRPVPSRHGDKYPPSDDVYEDGDGYIDVTNAHADLYGPKKDGRWPAEPLSLMGSFKDSHAAAKAALNCGGLDLTKCEE